MSARRKSGRRVARGKHGLIKLIRDNSLSIVLLGLFGTTLCLHAVAAWHQQIAILAIHGRPAPGFWTFAASGTFLDTLAVNWQAAILQLASLIIFSGFLYQRGAAHSRKPENSRHKKASTFGKWLYRNSLFIAFAALFIATLACHGVAGERAYNSELALQGQLPLTFAAYLTSAKFWSTTLETWEAEYGVIALYIVLSIFLRQESSAESKPPESSNDETGEANK